MPVFALRRRILPIAFVIANLAVLPLGASPSSAGINSHSIPVPAQPDALTVVGGDIWAASCSGNSVTELSRSNFKTIQTLTNSTYQFDCPDALAVVGGDIWVTNSLGNSITELSATTGQWIQTLTGAEILNPVGLNRPGFPGDFRTWKSHATLA